MKGNWKQFEDLVKGLNLQVMQPITKCPKRNNMRKYVL